jgi:2-methylcitrate dehydratase PrpD
VAVIAAQEFFMTALTSDIAAFVATVDAGAMPERCNFGARIGMLDCVGTMIAGSDEEAVQIVSRMVATSTTNDGAPEIPSGRNLAAPDAALVNGVAAHVLDYDDVGMDGHPSAALTPAILAEGWTRGASGEEAVAAYVAGYEVWALLQELEPGALHERGFHPTAIWGTLSAAAACARLNHLDAEQTTNAIAIAASLAAGTVANFGTMTKSLHAGRTAQSGVLAARLAKEGFTASHDVLEHKAGFMNAHTHAGNPAVTRGNWGLGQNWRLERMGINIKRYPMCYATHRSIDAMLDLAEQHNLKPDAIDEIHVRIGDAQDFMLRNRSPKTALEAKFSIEFAMASALIARRVGLKELDDGFVRRDDIIDVMRKVKRSTTDERLADMPPFSPDDRLSITLKSGEQLVHEPVVRPKGHWQKPLSENELREKFLDCTESRLGRAQAETLFERLNNLEDVTSLRELPLVRMG